MVTKLDTADLSNPSTPAQLLLRRGAHATGEENPVTPFDLNVIQVQTAEIVVTNPDTR
jgi:hypothetical protein